MIDVKPLGAREFFRLRPFSARGARRASLARNGPCAYLCALRDGRPTARLLTGVDLRYVRSTGRRAGWFACFDALDDEAAARALFAAAAAFQREKGSDLLRGPLAPDGGAAFEGLLVSGRAGPGCADQPLHLARLLQNAGFIPDRTLLSFRFAADAPPADCLQMAAARWAARGYAVERLAPNGSRALCAALYDLFDAERARLSLRDFADQVARLGPLCGKNLFLVRARGQLAGALLAFPGREAYRVATLQIAPAWRRSPACACLLAGALAAARAAGHAQIEGSVIAADNAASLALARGLGGRQSAAHQIFVLEL